MDTKKLFHVLVVGGGILAATGANAESIAFCEPTDESVCTVNEDGESVPRDGVVCCWGTTCDDQTK